MGEMRFLEPVRMADDGDHGPVWARSRRRGGGNPIIGLIVTLLALFGALTAVLAIKEQSVAEGGVIVDRWLGAAWDGAKKLAGQAPEAAEEAAQEAGEAAEKTGDALEAGADKTAQELKKN
jgi:hypothetical protein